MRVCRQCTKQMNFQLIVCAIVAIILIIVAQFTTFGLLDYWYMFFMCIIISAIAMSSGIGGATFFVPFVLLVLDVPIASAIAIGIFVEIFGFAFGVYNHWRRGSVDVILAGKIIQYAAPLVLIGVILNHLLEPKIIEYIFILALMIFATQLLLHHSRREEKEKRFDFGGAMISGLGGLLLGFVSSGLGEANEYNLFVRLRRKPAIVAGTSVLVVAVCAIIATIIQTIYFVSSEQLGAIAPYTMLIIYSVLGAYFGAWLGAQVASGVDRDKFRSFISVLLYVVALVSIVRVAFV